MTLSPINTFIQTLGSKTVANIPEAEPSALNLKPLHISNREVVTPDMLKQSLAKGHMADKFFIAAKVDLFANGHFVTQVVELIMISSKGLCTTALVNKGADNNSYPSGFYSFEQTAEKKELRRVTEAPVYMTQKDITRFKDLLDGKEVSHKTLPNYSMKLSS